MLKIDHRKTLKHLYHPPQRFKMVEVPEMQFIMVDGYGDSNTARQPVKKA